MKTMIIGPYRYLSDAENKALAPDDDKNPVGRNLWELMNERTGVSKEDYSAMFDRYGLCVGTWRYGPASDYFNKLPLGDYDLILFVGSNAKSVVPRSLFYPTVGIRHNMAFVPYPGVGSKFYTNPIQKEAATLLLEEVYWLASS